MYKIYLIHIEIFKGTLGKGLAIYSDNLIKEDIMIVVVLIHKNKMNANAYNQKRKIKNSTTVALIKMMKRNKIVIVLLTKLQKEKNWSMDINS